MITVEGNNRLEDRKRRRGVLLEAGEMIGRTDK